MQICDILGPYYVPYVIREARHVLKHGYQLHVLAVTVFDSLLSINCCILINRLKF